MEIEVCRFGGASWIIARLGIAVQQIRGFVVESLMTRGNDEAFSLYGLLARTVETDDARIGVQSFLEHGPGQATFNGR